MNLEQIEATLCGLKDKPVILIVPQVGHSSMSYMSDLQVVTTVEHSCGFHLSNSLGGWAVIFYAEDVQSLENSKSDGVSMVIRLKK